jgi:lipoprotein-releasing system permease protein
MYFAFQVAFRFLREGRNQTVLIVVGAGVGVGVMVFLSSLISGLQASLIRQTLDTQAHVTIRPPDDEARPVTTDRDGALFVDRVQRPAQRLRSIGSWPSVIARVRHTPGVVAATPTVNGPAFAVRGAASRSIALRGIDPASFDRVPPIASRLTAGRLRVEGFSAVIGVELAEELGLRVGDRLRISTATAPETSFTVSGIFDLGNRDVNERWVFVSLPAAQTLLDLAGGVSTIEVRVERVFEAEATARVLEARTGLVGESWMERNRQLLVALKSQSSSSVMIQVFVVVAVALGIASVLGISVVQKSREIGILRAMGAGAGQVTRVFLVQGLFVGLAGSVLGCALGGGLALLFQGLVTNPDGSATFPVDLSPSLFLQAAGVAVATGLLASVAPARRAARLDPATVLRNA